MENVLTLKSTITQMSMLFRTLKEVVNEKIIFIMS